MTNPDGYIVLAKAYDPYGVNNLDNGAASTSYGFTGEYTEPTVCPSSDITLTSVFSRSTVHGLPSRNIF